MPSVFISYQTRTHRQYIPAIKQVLSEAGLTVWVDEDNPVPGLQAEGLDTSLQSGLRQSDVLLFLIPRPGRQLTLGQKILEGLDVFTSLLSHEYSTSAQDVNYLLNVRYRGELYGLKLERRLGESWQHWEARVGRQLGLTVVQLAIQAEGEEPFDAPAVADPGAPSTSALAPSSNVIEGALCVSAENLEQELLHKVVPRLLEAPPRRPPEMLPEWAGLLNELKSCLFYLLAFAALAVLIALGLIALSIYLFRWKAVLALALIAALLAVRLYGPRAVGWVRARLPGFRTPKD